MNAALGTAGVALGLAAALLGIVTLAVGIRSRRAKLLRLGRAYAWLVLAGAVVATVAMERSLITRDFSLTYVADNGSHATPALYNVATLWAALEGSIILWSLVLAGFTVGVVVKFRARLADPLVAWATLVMLVVCAFFFVLMAGPANPFTVVAGAIPTDGPGPNPLLQNHPLMAIHPPMLYLGYVGFTVPFAFAVAALVTGRLGEGWLAATRRWTLLAWGFLTVGIGLGAWWSYEVLGWGGFWAWDPVENASLLPWLTGTAYLHSVMVQERRGMLRVWNLSLLLATFSLTILGTFLTRSGVLDSVHSFTESPIGVWLLCAFAATVVVTVGLIGWRGDRLRSPGSIDSPVSREGAFLLNNLLFAAFAFVVLLGTVFPLVVEAVNDDRISVGNPYFDRMTAPIGLALLFLMAVAPALPWRRTSGELLWARLRWPTWAGAGAVVVAVAVGARGVLPLAAFALAGFAGAAAIRQVVVAVGVARSQGRSPLWGFVGRSNGGMVVHLGVVVVAVAFTAASSYTTSGAFTLVEGASVSIGGHTVTYEGMNPEDVTPQRTQRSARVRIDGEQVYEPALNQFPNGGQTVGTPSVQPGAVDDVYLTLIAPPEREGGPAVIGVIIEPLVSWLWVGGGIMGLGTLLSAWPTRRRGRGPDPAALTSSDGAPAAGADPRSTGPAAGPGVDLRPSPAPSPDATGEPERVPTRARADVAAETDTDLLDDELDPLDDVVGPRRGRTALVAALTVGAVLAALIVALATGEPATSRLSDSPLLGQRAPELVGTSVLSGADFDLDDERGRWVVVNFFATWCEPCRREHPDLVRFAAAHAEAGDARVVSVVFSDEVADVERFFAERGGDWPVVDDDSGIVPRWGVSNVPESYLVDPAGRVVAKIVGGTTFDGLEDLLDRAQGGPGSADA